MAESLDERLRRFRGPDRGWFRCSASTPDRLIIGYGADSDQADERDAQSCLWAVGARDFFRAAPTDSTIVVVNGETCSPELFETIGRLCDESECAVEVNAIKHPQGLGYAALDARILPDEQFFERFAAPLARASWVVSLIRISPSITLAGALQALRVTPGAHAHYPDGMAELVWSGEREAEYVSLSAPAPLADQIMQAYDILATPAHESD